MRKQCLGVTLQINVLVLNQESSKADWLAKGLLDLSFQSLLVASANGWQNARAVGIQGSSALRDSFGPCPLQALPSLLECPYDAKLAVYDIQLIICFVCVVNYLKHTCCFNDVMETYAKQLRRSFTCVQQCHLLEMMIAQILIIKQVNIDL